MDTNSQFIIYQTEGGQTKIEVLLEEETVWLTQKLMANLFQTSVPNINIHLKNIFEEGELIEDRTIKEFLIVQKEGSREVKRKQVCYNLDAIISVGYRVKSHTATKFRPLGWRARHARATPYTRKPFTSSAIGAKKRKRFSIHSKSRQDLEYYL